MTGRILLYFILLIGLVALPCHQVMAQKKQTIEIENADEMRFVERDGTKIRKLTGNVILRQKDVWLNCDSALFYTHKNAVDAYGNVRINQGDSIRIFSDSLKYFGNEKKAIFYQNVRMFYDPDRTLTTDLLHYDMEKKVADYFTGAKLNQGSTQLTSKKGSWFSNPEIAWFRDSVILMHPDYSIVTDSMRYSTASETAWFFGPTEIETKDSKIYCETGWYNTPSGNSTFGKKTRITRENQLIESDSIWIEEEKGYSRMFDFFRLFELKEEIMVSGFKGEFWRESDRLLVTDSALLAFRSGKDTLFIGADTLMSISDSLDGKTFFAWYGVRIFKPDFQGICDSLMYSEKDSVLSMYFDPVLWNENNQMSGDTIHIFMKGKEPEKITLDNRAMMVSKSHPKLFDQIKGNEIDGFFVEGEMDHLWVTGGAESIYFAADEQGRFIGMNRAKSERMKVLIREKKVEKIVFYEQPEAVFMPMSEAVGKEDRLTGFNWREAERPKQEEPRTKRKPSGKKRPAVPAKKPKLKGENAP